VGSCLSRAIAFWWSFRAAREIAIIAL
jgi:hypothetical protein